MLKMLVYQIECLHFLETSFPLVGNLSFINHILARGFRTSRNDIMLQALSLFRGGFNLFSFFTNEPKILKYIIISAACGMILLHGCSHVDYQSKDIGRNQQGLPPDTALQEMILGLNPQHITENDIREVLSKCPAPRIINLNGSFPWVTMDSFSRFLIEMGYPEESILNPQNNSLSYSSYISSEKLAGLLAWYYEKEGMMPLLIGHSQGGMKVVEVLHELAGAFHKQIHVWNPLTGMREERYAITDPLTGAEQGVIGLKLGYASAVGTGKLMRFVLGQWDMLGRLRQIPDTVEEFTGFYIKYDLIGSDFLGFGRSNKYYPLGTASVRNITLPEQYSHITIPLTEHLAKNNVTRQWIQAYVPSAEQPEHIEFDVNSKNIIFAAETWYNIKKYWCIELQRLILAKRETGDKMRFINLNTVVATN